MPATLHEILARGTAVEWFEAVALVQALAGRLAGGEAGQDIRVPDLHEIVLGADGQVEATGTGPSHQSPVYRLGQLLTALVADRPMPPPLRLLALAAESSEPRFGTVREFTAALEYYERPGRTAILEALYRRFEQMPEAGAAAGTVEEIPAAPPPKADAATAGRRKRCLGLAAAVAAVLLAVAALGSWPMLRARVRWLDRNSSQASAAVKATTDAIARTVASGIEAVQEQFAGTREAEAPKSVLPPPPAPAAPSPAPRRVPASLPSTAGWLKPGNPAVFLPAAVPAIALEHPLEPVVEQPPLPSPAVEPGEWTIYSADNVDVVPPVPLHAKLPSEPPAGVSADSLPLVELIISPTGEVESVRMLTPSPSVTTSMMVSAVKAWRFRPATRNGRPVRYRYFVRLTVQ